MTLNESVELLQSKEENKLVRSHQFIRNDGSARYTLSIDDNPAYIILTSNDRVVAFYDYANDKFLIESYKVDKEGFVRLGMTRQSTIHINEFIKEIILITQKFNYKPKVVNLVYFDYYYQNYKDKLKDLL